VVYFQFNDVSSKVFTPRKVIETMSKEKSLFD